MAHSLNVAVASFSRHRYKTRGFPIRGRYSAFPSDCSGSISNSGSVFHFFYLFYFLHLKYFITIFIPSAKYMFCPVFTVSHLSTPSRGLKDNPYFVIISATATLLILWFPFCRGESGVLVTLYGYFCNLFPLVPVVGLFSPMFFLLCLSQISLLSSFFMDVIFVDYYCFQIAMTMAFFAMYVS